LFGLSKQAYYKQLKYNEQKTADWAQIRKVILDLRRSMPRLGTRKLHYLLKQQGVVIGRDRLIELLRQEDMLVRTRKRYVRTTNSKHWMRKYPNLSEGIELTRPEQLWVADITYLDTTAEGNVYLHLITDAYSKQIMGYELSNNMEAISTLKALKMGLKNRKYTDMPLIHHSDRGLQYCSKIYTKCLINSNIAISMTQSGSPYENAVAERINGILKDEFGLADELNNIKEAWTQVSESIKTYNTLRPHMSCNLRTPEQMHSQQDIKIKTYKNAKYPKQQSTFLTIIA
jgi:transposase InsO family protein